MDADTLAKATELAKQIERYKGYLRNINSTSNATLYGEEFPRGEKQILIWDGEIVEPVKALLKAQVENKIKKLEKELQNL